jgi:hypothetical protein
MNFWGQNTHVISKEIIIIDNCSTNINTAAIKNYISTQINLSNELLHLSKKKKEKQ